MTTFDEREKAFEAQFSHDEELRFKVLVRRNKLVGLWAAEMLSLSGDEAKNYTRELIVGDFDRPGPQSPEQRLFAKLRADFDEAGIELSDHRLRAKIAELGEEALRQIKSE